MSQMKRGWGLFENSDQVMHWKQKGCRFIMQCSFVILLHSVDSSTSIIEPNSVSVTTIIVCIHTPMIPKDVEIYGNPTRDCNNRFRYTQLMPYQVWINGGSHQWWTENRTGRPEYAPSHSCLLWGRWITSVSTGCIPSSEEGMIHKTCYM